MRIIFSFLLLTVGWASGQKVLAADNPGFTPRFIIDRLPDGRLSRLRLLTGPTTTIVDPPRTWRINRMLMKVDGATLADQPITQPGEISLTRFDFTQLPTTYTVYWEVHFHSNDTGLPPDSGFISSTTQFANPVLPPGQLAVDNIVREQRSLSDHGHVMATLTSSLHGPTTFGTVKCWVDGFLITSQTVSQSLPPGKGAAFEVLPYDRVSQLVDMGPATFRVVVEVDYLGTDPYGQEHKLEVKQTQFMPIPSRAKGGLFVARLAPVKDHPGEFGRVVASLNGGAEGSARLRSVRCWIDGAQVVETEPPLEVAAGETSTVEVLPDEIVRRYAGTHDVKVEILYAGVSAFGEEELKTAAFAQVVDFPAPRPPTFENVYSFPNPAPKGVNPVLHIETGLADSLDLRIYNLEGECVYQTSFSGAPSVLPNGGLGYEKVWNVADVAPGVYRGVVIAHNDKGQDTRKFKFAVMK